MTVTLEPPVRWWNCPSCFQTQRTQGVDLAVHQCPALFGMTMPYVEVSNYDVVADGRQVLVEREDYIGTSNAGRVMAVRTEHADGSNDCTVYAPTAELDAL